MVFYGKKRASQDRNNEQYQSIKEQILRELGQRITPIQQKSIASILSDAGDAILIITQSILNFPQYWRETQLYQSYLADKQQFKTQMQPDVLWYNALPKRVTQNKFFFIKNYTIFQRIMALNAFVFLTGVLSFRINKGFTSRMRGLMKSCLVGYTLGGAFFVPEVYNSVFLDKTV